MPEGHTLHRAAREHRRLFAGVAVRASSPQGRFAESAALLDGRVMVTSQAWGKHLFHTFDGDQVLHVHLGLAGVHRSGPGEPPPAAASVRLRLAAPLGYVDLLGPAVCELVTPLQQAAVLARLGPDPLRRGADPARFVRRVLGSRAPVAGLLMDQTVVAGIGNVFRAEALFRAGMDPYVPGAALDVERVDALWADLRTLLRDGVRRGRIVTTPRGSLAERYVYGRAGEPCMVCAAPVASAPLLGRTLYWCPRCQR